MEGVSTDVVQARAEKAELESSVTIGQSQFEFAYIIPTWLNKRPGY